MSGKRNYQGGDDDADNKRQRTSGLQYNEDEVRPGPESGVDAQTGRYIRSQLHVREWGLPDDPVSTAKKGQFYAAAGGHVPGVYGHWNRIKFNNFIGTDILADGPGNKQKGGFRTRDAAWDHMEAHRGLIETALDWEHGRAYLEVQRKKSPDPATAQRNRQLAQQFAAMQAARSQPRPTQQTPTTSAPQYQATAQQQIPTNFPPQSQPRTIQQTPTITAPQYQPTAQQQIPTTTPQYQPIAQQQIPTTSASQFQPRAQQQILTTSAPQFQAQAQQQIPTTSVPQPQPRIIQQIPMTSAPQPQSQMIQQIPTTFAPQPQPRTSQQTPTQFASQSQPGTIQQAPTQFDSQSQPQTPQRASTSSSRPSTESFATYSSSQAVTPGSHDTPLTSPEMSQELSSAKDPTSSDTDTTEPEVVLSDEQQRVVDCIMQGRNVFYTGSAGSGKSAILRAFKKQLKAMGKHVVVTAPTNLAALNVGGVTIFSYAGWNPKTNEDSIGLMIKKLIGQDKDKTIATHFQETDVLVIDEISMLESNALRRLNALMKYARDSSEPFGGVQMVVTGDFCQLPPVLPFQHCFQCGTKLEKDKRKYTCPRETDLEGNPDTCDEREFRENDKWAFRSDAWRECRFEHFHLTKIYRQADPMFQTILQRYRLNGNVTPAQKQMLLDTGSKEVDAVALFPRNAEVDELNDERVGQLPTPVVTYTCKDNFQWKDEHRNNPYLKIIDEQRPLIKEHRYERNLDLKDGMRVLLLQNLSPEQGLVNGSQGEIIGFEDYDEAKLPNKQNGGLSGPHAKYYHYQIRDFAKENGRKSWPIVKFDNGQTRTIYADCMGTEYGDSEPYSVLSRTQIPLKAGYAMTIHKAQGMSLDKVKINLWEAFHFEQLYVALSRARSLEGLQLVAMPKRTWLKPDQQVKEFLQKFSQ